MKNVLLTTAAVALMLGFASSAQAVGGSEPGKLTVYMDFDSSVQFYSQKELYLGKFNISDLLKGGTIVLDQSGDATKSTIKAKGAGHYGEMRLHDPAGYATANLAEMQVNGIQLKMDANTLTALGQGNGITLSQPQSKVVCGEITAVGITAGKLTDPNSQTDMDFNVGAEFTVGISGGVLDKNDTCEGEITITAVY